MIPPITIYLIGYAGSGKYTIAKEISKHGYKVVDNHLINNPIFSLLDLDDKTPIPEDARLFTRKIRHIILDFVSHNKNQNFVFTNELVEAENDRAVYNLVHKTADKRSSLFVPVKLTLEHEEHKKRITNPDRKLKFKTTNPDDLLEKKEFIKIDHPHLLEIDVSDLSATESAKAILNFVESLQK